MDFALSTFIIIVLLTPGLIFRRFYYTEEFSKQYIKQNFFELFIASFLPSLLFHFIWFYVIQIFSYKVDLEVLGDVFTDSKTNKLFANIQIYTLQIFLYHITIFLFSSFAGYLCKLIVRKLKLDRRKKIFRYQNSWHYLFSGEFFDFPKSSFDLLNDKVEEIEFFYLDVLTEISDSTVLYEGVLVDYELANDGGLNYIVLKGTQRRFIKTSGDNSGIKQKPYQVPGHILIIPYNSIINMNISFYKLEEIDDETYQVVLVE